MLLGVSLFYIYKPIPGSPETRAVESVLEYYVPPFDGIVNVELSPGQAGELKYEMSFKVVVLSGRCRIEHFDKNGSSLQFERPKESGQWNHFYIQEAGEPNIDYDAYKGSVRVKADPDLATGEGCKAQFVFTPPGA